MVLMAGALLLGGCINARNTRLPTLGYGDPQSERDSYALHDPLPERESGPAMSIRPNGFDRNRTEPRRVLEQSTPRGLMPGAVVAPPPAPPATTSSYPQTVRP